MRLIRGNIRSIPERWWRRPIVLLWELSEFIHLRMHLRRHRLWLGVTSWAIIVLLPIVLLKPTLVCIMIHRVVCLCWSCLLWLDIVRVHHLWGLSVRL